MFHKLKDLELLDVLLDFLEAETAKANRTANVANESRLITTSLRMPARWEEMLFIFGSFFGLLTRGSGI